MNPFHIVTEFRFDIAHAVAGSETLQNQVGKVSDAANNALLSIQRMGIGLVGQLGLGTGGVLGSLWAAIQASDKFAASQRALSNIFLSNQGAMGIQGLTFEAAMSRSSKILDTINDKAREFGLDGSSLAGATKGIAPVLVSHGLDKMDLNNSIDIARGLLKSAPTLGVDPNLVTNQLIQAITGHAQMNDTLFQRLVSETQPFKDAGITGSKQFNALDAAKRVDILRRALLQFGSNTKVLEGNVNSISGQMTKLSNNLKGMYSIFKPIGDAIAKPLIEIMQKVNEYLDTHGRRAIKDISGVLDKVLKDPIALYERLTQLSRLKTDFISAGKVASLFGLFDAIKFGLGFLGIQLKGNLLTYASIGFGKLFSILGNGLKFLFATEKGLNAVWFVTRLFGTAIRAISVVLLPLLYFFQIFSLAIGKTKVMLAQWWADNFTRISAAFVKISDYFGKVIKPIMMGMDILAHGLAKIFAWILAPDMWLAFAEGLGEVLRIIELVVNGIVGVIAGLENVMIGFFHGALNGNFSQAFDFAKNYTEGRDDYWGKINGVNVDEEMGATKKVTNIYGDININNNIKEQVEPDRIAYSLTQQLMKVAENPKQAAGRSMRGSYAQ